MSCIAFSAYGAMLVGAGIDDFDGGYRKRILAVKIMKKLDAYKVRLKLDR